MLDGALLSGDGIYKEFVDYIANLYNNNSNANYFTNEASWQESITNYGVCGKFVYDEENNTVRLPKITGIIEGTTEVSALLDLVEAGLPNITGRIDQWLIGSGGLQNTGAFSASSDTGSGKYAGTTTTTTIQVVDFDASFSNSIYGNSDTAQPQTIKVLYYIVIGTVLKTEIEVDIDNIATDLNGKVDVDLTNISDTGYIKMAGAAMPSGTAIAVTLGASGASYTSPADGYFICNKNSSAVGQYVHMSCNNILSICYATTTSAGLLAWVPVKKSAICKVTYNAGGATNYFNFVYAVGAESEAQ